MGPGHGRRARSIGRPTLGPHHEDRRMTATLSGASIRAGVWEAIVTGIAVLPSLEVMHLERALPGLNCTPFEGQPGAWRVRVPIPVEVLHDGVQTFVLRNTVDETRLGHFTLIAGVAMEDDIRAEIDLLRAELDMLKRAFRRHCLETAG